MTIASAGTRSPASSAKMSPGTTSRMARSFSSPPRMTAAVIVTFSCSASAACADLYVLKKSMNALPNTIAKMMTASICDPKMPEMIAAAIRNICNGFRNFEKNIKSGCSFFFPANSFKPYVFNRAAASVAESPLLEVCSAENISSGVFPTSAVNDSSSAITPSLPDMKI